MRKLPAVAQSHSRFNQARPEAKLNVVIVISYTAYVQRSDYTQTINRLVRSSPKKPVTTILQIFLSLVSH
jgi:hypothetical protein